MADYNSSLPIRSEADGADERVQVKIVDADNPDTQQMEVDTDNNAHVEVHGNRADDAADVALQLSEEGRPNGRGDFHADDNSKPASVGLIAHTRNAAKTEAHQGKRVSAIDSSVDTDVTALDVAIRDEEGNPYSQSNPLPVSLEESEGDEVHNFNTGADVIKDASANHDYVVADGDTFLLKQVLASASGKLRITLQIGDGAGSEVFTTVARRRNSTAEPQCDIDLKEPIKVVGTVNGTTVRVIKTNLDNQPQDLDSTIVGVTRT